MTKIIKAWGGFTSDKLYAEPDDGTYNEPRLAIFPTKKAAARTFEDVRRIEIHITPPDAAGGA